MPVGTTLPFVALSLAIAGAAAQSMPTDNDQWSARCAMMVSNGGVPAVDSSGIAPDRFEQLARERSSAGQHFVACNLFFAAAAGFAAQSNAQQSQTDVSMAKLEQKLGMKVKLSFMDKLSRTSETIDAVAKQSAPSSPQEISAVSMMVGSAGPGGFAPPPSAYAAPNAAAPAQFPQPGPPLQSAAFSAGQYLEPPGAAPTALPPYPIVPTPNGQPLTNAQGCAPARPHAAISTTGPLNRQLIEQVVQDSLDSDTNNGIAPSSLNFHSVQIAKARVAHSDPGILDGTTFYPVLVKFTNCTLTPPDPQSAMHDIVQVYDFFRDDFGNWVLKAAASPENRNVQSQHN